MSNLIARITEAQQEIRQGNIFYAHMLWGLLEDAQAEGLMLEVVGVTQIEAHELLVRELKAALAELQEGKPDTYGFNPFILAVHTQNGPQPDVSVEALGTTQEEILRLCPNLHDDTVYCMRKGIVQPYFWPLYADLIAGRINLETLGVTQAEIDQFKVKYLEKFPTHTWNETAPSSV